jgi:hypothetical protein
MSSLSNEGAKQASKTKIDQTQEQLALAISQQYESGKRKRLNRDRITFIAAWDADNISIFPVDPQMTRKSAD